MQEWTVGGVHEWEFDGVPRTSRDFETTAVANVVIAGGEIQGKDTRPSDIISLLGFSDRTSIPLFLCERLVQS